jgi:hypothetical protein
MQIIPLAERISSFQLLCKQISEMGVAPEIMAQAIEANTWFTEYYIQNSIKSILPWAAELPSFLANYDLSNQQNAPKKIGIIAAGNVPFVCMHDILMAIFSGHIALVKFSHQDAILPKWFCEKWIEILPKLADFLHFVPTIGDCDFLIATGSNNTANALNYQFSEMPKLIRKHRFSVALIKNDTSAKNLTFLCRDILWYNGLGCRNVSHLFLPKDFSLAKLENALNEYNITSLSENYLQKLKVNEAKLKMFGEKYAATKTAILQFQPDIQFSYLGIVNLILYENEREVEAQLTSLQSQIQCIVGQNIDFGQSQLPFLSDFADGEDSMALLLKLKQ